MNEEEQKGKTRVLSDDFDHNKMGHVYDAMPYWAHNRALVRQYGQCEGGCKPENLTTNNLGKQVCRRTFRQCPLTSLALLVKRYSIINQKKD